MKRSVVFFGLVLGAVAGLAAQSVSLTNTFGGNSDNVGTSDFLKFANDGTKVTAIVGDRVQLDFASEHIDSRVRLNVSGDAGYIPSVQGYVNFRPFDWLAFSSVSSVSPQKRIPFDCSSHQKEP